ncbi:hypothetical protein F5883DRAFT_527800 [Diaporthe sp. PMI_573]|nr:hypothetical protein F5883DRAFT_527800 [Diaporthaceae sp. PMI_573]
MSPHYCHICFCPVYQVLSQRVQAYSLVTQACPQRLTQQGTNTIPTPIVEADHAGPSKAPRKKVPAKNRRAKSVKAPQKKAKFDIPVLEKPLSELPTSEGSDPMAEATIWAMESDHVKQSFRALAKTDFSLHNQAFPDYKFQPHQNKVPESKDRIRRLKTS